MSSEGEAGQVWAGPPQALLEKVQAARQKMQVSGHHITERRTLQTTVAEEAKNKLLLGLTVPAEDLGRPAGTQR